MGCVKRLIGSCQKPSGRLKNDKMNPNPFEKLMEILAKLRGPNGCPWDQEQTHQTIKAQMLEEVYETLETIDKEDWGHLQEELGDLLLHIFFHCQLASEEGRFDAPAVAEKLCEKIIRRHPHIFGDTKVKNTDEVLQNWEKIKAKEKSSLDKLGTTSILDGLPKSAPALVVAYRLGEKTSRVGFDWKDKTGPLEKIKEEMAEFEESLAGKNNNEIEHEIGDLFTALANLSRHLKIDPETALRKANQRFQNRFQLIEKKCKAENKELQQLTFKEWDELWEEAKSSTE
ncbi:MAG: nucleoside triphosphate pyrophosphohydrolase [Deltaproteobacteria bacterium]|nr:nucleoside triphosphate pyrophosphohydrolase [Deltaproteobacteria bacterium]